MKHLKPLKLAFSAITLLGLGIVSNSAYAATILTTADGVVRNSLCVGGDCPANPSFGFDTLILQENNTRLHFLDTSSTASFPDNDWRFIANDSSNGGGEYLAIEDSSAGRKVFRVDAGAPTDSLRVRSNGNVGLGVASPVVELHIKDGDTPTVRLDQDGSSGFTPQIWDMAGNETNFFIRDVTGGSTLPFRIRPGAPTDSLEILADGDVHFKEKIGIGTNNPEDSLHISKAAAARFRLTNTSITDSLTNDKTWLFNSNGTLRIKGISSPVVALTLAANGDLTVAGDINSGGTTVVPDYVFEPDYKLMPLEEVRKHISEKGHLPNIPSAKEVKEKGSLNMSKMQMKLLEKVEELTLYTLAQEKTIKQTIAKSSQLQKQATAKNDQLQQRLAKLEKLLTDLTSGKESLPVNGEKVAIIK